MRWWSLLGLCACNQTLGLEHTQVVDASFFDVREDFTCPPFGETPKFAAAATTIATNCSHYSESKTKGRAIAYCGNSASGPLDGPFVEIAGLMDGRYGLPRLAPEGDTLYVRDTTADVLRIYNRSGDNDFTPAATVDLSSGTGQITEGVPARGGRMLWGRAVVSPPPAFDEIVINSDGSIASTITHDISELGIQALGGVPNLTPDGLHIVFPGRVNNVSSVMYADRQAVGDPFSTARVLDNIPFELLQTPFMNETCSRIYFRSGDQLVWAQRLE
jgi:hypothetical protein